MRVRAFAIALTCTVMPLTACGSSSKGSSSPADSATATKATAAPTTALPVADPVAVAAWFKDSRHHMGLKSLDSDLAGYTSATKAANAADILSACNYLAHDVRILKTLEPIPDAPSQASWAAALADLEKGSADCNTGDAAQAAKAKSEISKGNGEYGAVIDRLGTVLGQSPTSSPT